MIKLILFSLFYSFATFQFAFAQQAPQFKVPFVVKVRADNETTERIYDGPKSEKYFAQICAQSIPEPKSSDFKVIYHDKDGKELNYVLHQGDCTSFSRGGPISIRVYNTSGKTLDYRGTLELTFR